MLTRFRIHGIPRENSHELCEIIKTCFDVDTYLEGTEHDDMDMEVVADIPPEADPDKYDVAINNFVNGFTAAMDLMAHKYGYARVQEFIGGVDD